MNDTRTFERDGFTVTVTKESDPESTPNDAECYSEEDIEAFRRGDWGYVGVVARAYRQDVELGMASLWSCEEGNMPSVGYVDAFGHTLGADPTDYDVPGEAIVSAKEALARLSTDA